jgi:hypothetical protein
MRTVSDDSTRWQEDCPIEDPTLRAGRSERSQPDSDVLPEAKADLDATRDQELLGRLATRNAKAEMSSVGSAARTAYLAVAANIGTTELSLEAVVAELGEQVEGVALDKDLRRGKAMLAAQADTLNLLYNLLAQRGIAAATSGKADQADVFLRLALRTQARCQSTWATLHAMASPPVARQTNIALLSQQVNNGQLSPTSDGRAQNPQGKLLEQTKHEPDAWLERSSPAAAASRNSQVAAMEASDGTAYGSRQRDRRA